MPGDVNLDRPTCGTCRHLMHTYYAHRCGRVMLPKPVGMYDPKYMGAWYPVVEFSDWCGEHAPVVPAKEADDAR